MQYERISKNLSKEKLKEIHLNLDVTFNGIVEFVKICSSQKPTNMQIAIELILDLFGVFRASKNIEMVQQVAQILIAICNNSKGLDDIFLSILNAKSDVLSEICDEKKQKT